MLKALILRSKAYRPIAVVQARRQTSATASKPQEHVDLDFAKQYFAQASKELKINKLSDWYLIRRKELVHIPGGIKVLKQHGNLYNALRAVYPTHEWLPWEFLQVSPAFWDSFENQKHFIDHVGRQIGIQRLEDWYNVKVGETEQKYKMRTLLEKHQRSLSRTLKFVYPDHAWEEWRFNVRTPRGFWDNISNQRRFWLSAGAQLGVRCLDDWYSVTIRSLTAHGCPSFVGSQYSWNLCEALKSAFPEHQWIEWKFETVPNRFWADRANQHRYLEWLRGEMNIGKTEPEAWYRVTGESVLKSFLAPFGGSFPVALRTLIPDHPWDESKFARTDASVGGGSKSRVGMRERVVDFASRNFPHALNSLDSWYEITPAMVSESGLGHFLRNKGITLHQALQQAFPDHSWDPLRFKYQTRPDST